MNVAVNPPENFLEANFFSNFYVVFFAILIQVGFQKRVNDLCYVKGTSDVTKNIVSELIKILIVIVFCRRELSEGFRRITLTNSLKFATIPAAIYAIQNFSTEAGKNLLDGTTFNVINQCKLLTVAIFQYWINDDDEYKPHPNPDIRRLSYFKQSIAQWFAIILCLVGTYFFFIYDPVLEKKDEGDFTTGWIFTVVATFLSGVSSAFIKRLNDQKLPKTNDGDSDVVFRRKSYVSTAELAVYQILIPMVLQVVMLCYHLYNNSDKPFPMTKGRLNLYSLDSYLPFFTIHFNQWSLLSFVPCVLNALGGLFIGAMLAFKVDKHGIDGGMERSKAFVCGMIITALLDSFLPLQRLVEEGKVLEFTIIKCVSALAIVIAVLMHSCHEYILEKFGFVVLPKPKPHRD